ncbi:MAG: hypothetical protein ACK4Q4_10745 [Rhodocyclaceae bacterium]
MLSLDQTILDHPKPRLVGVACAFIAAQGKALRCGRVGSPAEGGDTAKRRETSIHYFAHLPTGEIANVRMSPTNPYAAPSTAAW